MKCWTKGCSRTATLQVGFTCWAIKTPPGQRRHGNSARGLSSIVVCKECRRTLRPEDLLTAETKETIASTFQSHGRDLPDLSSVELTFKEVVGTPIDVEHGEDWE